MITPLKNAFPQRAIIMAIDGQTAKVFVPLAKFETDYIDSSVALDSTMVGHEVIVIFINGDRNQGVIVGVMP